MIHKERKGADSLRNALRLETKDGVTEYINFTAVIQLGNGVVSISTVSTTAGGYGSGCKGLRA